MDINYLLSREQISLMRARDAACPEARAAHEGLAKVYHAALEASSLPHRAMHDTVPRRPAAPRRSGNG